MAMSTGGGNGDTPQFTVANLIVQTSMELPDEQQQNLEFLEREAPQVNRMFRNFTRGGAAFMAAAGGMALLASQSSGFRELFRTMGELTSLFMDLVFVALLPVLQPMIQGMQRFAQFMVEEADRPGGILGAVLDPSFWARGARIFIDAMAESWGAFKSLWAQIWNSEEFRAGWQKVKDFIFDADKWTKVGGWIFSGFMSALSAADNLAGAAMETGWQASMGGSGHPGDDFGFLQGWGFSAGVGGLNPTPVKPIRGSWDWTRHGVQRAAQGRGPALMEPLR